MSAVELARVPSGLPAGRPSPAVAIEVVPGVRVPKAAELVAAELRGRIVSGELGDGAALPVEAVLMATFGVSRPTLREAFRVLESQGLLVVRRGAHGGATVRAPGEAFAALRVADVLDHRGVGTADIAEALAVIEAVSAARLARTRWLSREALSDAVDRAALVVDDPARFAAAAEEVLAVLVGRAGNATLLVLWRLLGQIHTAREGVALLDQPAAEERLDRFIVLLDQIEKGDVAGAARWGGIGV